MNNTWAELTREDGWRHKPPYWFMDVSLRPLKRLVLLRYGCRWWLFPQTAAVWRLFYVNKTTPAGEYCKPSAAVAGRKTGFPSCTQLRRRTDASETGSGRLWRPRLQSWRWASMGPRRKWRLVQNNSLSFLSFPVSPHRFRFSLLWKDTVEEITGAFFFFASPKAKPSF